MIPFNLLKKKRSKKDDPLYEYLYIEEFVSENIEQKEKPQENDEQRGITIIEIA